MRTAEGKLYLFAAIDRTSKLTFAQLAEKAARAVTSAFLDAPIKTVPDKIHAVLADAGISLRFPPCQTTRTMIHTFNMRRRENGSNTG